MISIRKNEWLNPEYIEGMELTSDGLHVAMSSGRVIYLIDDVMNILKQIEDYWGKKMGAIIEAPKPKRKYTKKKKVEDSADGPNYYSKDDEITNLGGE